MEGSDHVAFYHSLVVCQSGAGVAGQCPAGGGRYPGAVAHPGRCTARSLRCPGDCLHRVPGAGAAGGGGSGDLSADLGTVVGAEGAGGARLLVLRCLVCLCDLRGWYRPLLGAQPGTGVPEWPRQPVAGRCQPDTGAGCHRHRLGLSVCTARQGSDARQPAFVAGLGVALSAGGDTRCRRGGQCRWLRAPVSGGAGSAQIAGLRLVTIDGDGGHPRQQSGGRRSGHRAGGVRIHGAGPRLSARHTGSE